MERFINSLDSEQFIDAIKIHPAIWDSLHESYTDRGAKKRAWDTVVATFIQDYEERSLAEQKNLCNAFSRKWKSYRDCYSRECAKKRRESLSGSASYRKEYIYYEQLKFLGPVKHNSTFEEEAETNDYDPQDPDYPEEPSAKRRKAKSLREADVPKQKVADPDRLFMLSLVPEMKKVPDHMKLEVKSRLLAVFTNLTSKSTPNRTHRVKLPTVHVTVPIAINYDSNQTQPDVVANLNEVLLDPLCKPEPASDVEFESD